MSTPGLASESGATNAPSPAPALPPYPVLPPRPPKSPILALVLSLFPGIGQAYNGQFAKALTFFLMWAGSIYLTAEVDPMPFAFLIPFTYFFNLVDAYRSAVLINARAAGGTPLAEENTFESPAWGASLLVLGLLLLFNNLGWLQLIAFKRYWPLALVAAGVVFLMRARRPAETGGPRGQ